MALMPRGIEVTCICRIDKHKPLITKEITMTTTQTSLKQLEDEIARSRRMADFYDGDDDHLAETYERDAEQLGQVRDAIAAGDLAEAGRFAHHLETYVREQIPNDLWTAIIDAAGLGG
jgi:hypothetical protein